MKTWIPALAVLLGASSGFAAPTALSCSNQFQQTLEIVSDTEAATVSAVFTANGISQNLNGVIISGGKFKMEPTAANDSVTLALARPRQHGGGCGRCAVEETPLSTVLYAQLFVGPSVYVFQCEPKAL